MLQKNWATDENQVELWRFSCIAEIQSGSVALAVESGTQ